MKEDFGATTMAYRSKLRSCDGNESLEKMYDVNNIGSSDSEINSDENESDEGSSCSYNIDLSSNKSNTQESKPKRLTRKNPTRRPDPNVSNRNAVLARENRRRKKEHLEKLENDIKKSQNNNKKLEKIMKKQAKLINKLQYERNYYRNILINKKKLCSLIDVFRNSKTMFEKDPETKTRNISTNIPFIPYEGDYDYKCYNDDDDDEQWNLLGNISPLTMGTENLDSSSTSDFGFDSNSPLPDTLIESNIGSEHNYFTVNNNFVQKHDSQNAADDLGICLHVTQNGFSLEICPDCHQSSLNNKMPMEEEEMPDILV